MNSGEGRQKIWFNEDWKFFLGDSEKFSSANLENEASWKSVVLPHDWGMDYPVDENAISGSGGGYVQAGIGWYRKKFTAPEAERIEIQFDGVFQDSTIYLNGNEVGGWRYGYTEFTIDLTDHLVKGENLLAVRVDNSRQPNTRWYTGSGIYRNVYLLLLHDVHIKQNGIYIVTNGVYLEQSKARLQMQTYVENKGKKTANVLVEHHLFDAEGNEVAVTASAVNVKPDCEGRAMVTPMFDNPHLWSDKDPYLYTVETLLTVDSMIVDRLKTKIGIRTAEFDADKGFLLNGERVKIKGMCIHHDCGLTGSAHYREIWERRLLRLKDMGCNGIRTAHNPHSIEMLDLCDELGFLVMDEIFDEWLMPRLKGAVSAPAEFDKGLEKSLIPKNVKPQIYGYCEYFERDAEADLVTMLHRDRNHPSIVLWSIGNEIPEQSVKEGPKVLNFLQDICHREDPTRSVCVASHMIEAWEPGRSTFDYLDSIDVVGYNYAGRWYTRSETFYEDDKRRYPKRKMIGSENPSAGGIRGYYKTRESERFFRMDYDLVTHTHEYQWRFTGSRDYVAGDYLWTGVDYLGEARWPNVKATSGPIDTAGFQKDTFYYFRSLWNKEEITLHLVPHWNWKGREGEFITIIGYTNCESVSLYLNGRLVSTQGYDFPNATSLGPELVKTKYTTPTTHDLHLRWDVPYEAGELKAVGTIGGKEAAELIIKTTDSASSLKANADRSSIPLYGISNIEIEAFDKNGLFVANADNAVNVKTEGVIQFLGLDNGDPKDHTPYYNTERKMLAGKVLCIVRGIKKGNGKITISSEGMKDVSLDIQVE